MVSFINIEGWNHELWLKFRDRGLGGSELGSTCPIEHKYTDPIKIHLNKIGEPIPTFDGNRFTEFGHEMEPKIASWYQYYDHDTADVHKMLVNHRAKKHKQNTVRSVNAYILNSKYPQLFASIDRRILRNKQSADPLRVKGRGILEAKNTTSMEKKTYSLGINPSFFLQTQSYLMMTGWEYADIAIYYDGNNFEVVTLEPDQEVFDYIDYHTSKFWINVEKCRAIKKDYNIDYYFGRPDFDFTEKQKEGVAMLQALEPEITGTDNELAVIKSLVIPGEPETVAEGDDQLWAALVTRDRLKKEQKAYDNQITALDCKIILQMAGIEKVYWGSEEKMEMGWVSYKKDKLNRLSLRTKDKMFEVIKDVKEEL